MALQEVVLKVEGMSCNHCKMAVEKALKNLSGVHDVLVNLEAKTVTASFDPASVNKQQLTKVIDETGYQVVG